MLTSASLNCPPSACQFSKPSLANSFHRLLHSIPGFLLHASSGLAATLSSELFSVIGKKWHNLLRSQTPWHQGVLSCFFVTTFSSANKETPRSQSASYDELMTRMQGLETTWKKKKLYEFSLQLQLFHSPLIPSHSRLHILEYFVYYL